MFFRVPLPPPTAVRPPHRTENEACCVWKNAAVKQPPVSSLAFKTERFIPAVKKPLRFQPLVCTSPKRHALSLCLSVCLSVCLSSSLCLTHTQKLQTPRYGRKYFASLDSWRMLYKNYILIYLRWFIPVVLLNQYILFSMQSYTSLWCKF